ncbi:MAG: hypothetical protein KUL74_09835 [Cloacibacterium sp.]|nr:hypothetical protein [Cloacibacterium sp.]
MKKLITFLALVFLFESMIQCTTRDDSNGTKTTTVIPLTPTNLSAQVISTPAQVNLNWTDNSTNEEGFKIERKISSGAYNFIGQINKDITNFIDTSVQPNTTYTYRVYSYNSAGASITYTNEVTVTITSTPVISSTAISNVTSISSNSGGNISNDGGSPVISRGVCWSTSPNPTVGLTTKTVNGSGTGTFTSNIESLEPNTTYYVRAYATNINGTSYGNELTFRTDPINLTNGLIAFYPFNGNANDISGNGNNGVVTRASLTSDRFGNLNSAYDFNFNGMTWTSALHQLINIPYNQTFSTDKLSYSVWIYPRSYHFPNIPTNDKVSRIIGRVEQGYSNPNGETWHLDLSNGYITASILSASTTIDQQYENLSAPINNLNSWYHIVFTKDDTSSKLYINGVLVSEKVSNFRINTLGTSGISIGSSNQANGYWYESDSKIDDIRIYNRALTSSEVLYLSKQ